MLDLLPRVLPLLLLHLEALHEVPVDLDAEARALGQGDRATGGLDLFLDGEGLRQQFLAEAVALATLGGLLGILAGWGLAQFVGLISPLPARVTVWSISLALGLGASVGVIFGVVPAARAAKLDPVVAMRSE